MLWQKGKQWECSGVGARFEPGLDWRRNDEGCHHLWWKSLNKAFKMWYLIPQAFQSGLPDLQDNQRSKPQTFSFFQLLSYTAVQHKIIFIFAYFNNPGRFGFVSKTATQTIKWKKKIRKWLRSVFFNVLICHWSLNILFPGVSLDLCVGRKY